MCRSNELVNKVKEYVSQSESCDNKEYTVNLVCASSSSIISPDRNFLSVTNISRRDKIQNFPKSFRYESSPGMTRYYFLPVCY